MKVYIVMRTEGGVGDCSESVEAVFLDEQKAQTFAKNKGWDFVNNRSKISGVDYWVDDPHEVVE